ncbi:hypothetical protein Bbelb_418300 [Branchiostoma belcheri]|nr:hypothetical protein Bbelb_418300 [Branchiostoma belcheri]
MDANRQHKRLYDEEKTAMRLDDYSREVLAWKQKYERLEVTVMSKDSEIFELNSRVTLFEEIRTERDELRVELEKMHVQLTETQRSEVRDDDLQIELNNLRAQSRELQAVKKEMVGHDSHNEIKRWRQQCDDLRSAAAKLEAENQKLSTELEMFRKGLIDMQAEKEALMLELERIKRERDDFQSAQAMLGQAYQSDGRNGRSN